MDYLTGALSVSTDLVGNSFVYLFDLEQGVKRAILGQFGELNTLLMPLRGRRCYECRGRRIQSITVISSSTWVLFDRFI